MQAASNIKELRLYTTHKRPAIKKSIIFPFRLPWLEPLVNEHPLVSDRYIKTPQYRGPLNAQIKPTGSFLPDISCRDADARRHLKWELKQNWMQSKGLIYLRPTGICTTLFQGKRVCKLHIKNTILPPLLYRFRSQPVLYFPGRRPAKYSRLKYPI